MTDQMLHYIVWHTHTVPDSSLVPGGRYLWFSSQAKPNSVWCFLFTLCSGSKHMYRFYFSELVEHWVLLEGRYFKNLVWIMEQSAMQCASLWQWPWEPKRLWKWRWSWAWAVPCSQCVWIVRLCCMLCCREMAVVHLMVLAQDSVLSAGYCLQGRHLAGAFSR